MLSTSGSMTGLAPGGPLVVVDIYPAESMLRPPRRIRARSACRVLPLRARRRPNPVQSPDRCLIPDDRDFFAVYQPLPGPVTVPFN
jgi:hypothetical protein